MTTVLVVLAVVAALAVLLLWRRRHAAWTGFGDRTLWDWLALTIEAVLIGVATLAITATQQRVEDSRVRSEAVQGYLDRTTDLVTGADLDGDDVRAVVRAHTREVLRIADPDGAARVLVFLDEVGMLADLDLRVAGLDLSGSELEDVDLSGLDLDEVDLSGADLEGAVLRGLELEDLAMAGADLGGADLRDTVVEGESLAGTDLDGADLRAADLGAATGLTDDQLAVACTDAATVLPADVDVELGCEPSGDGDEDDD